jgi:hypothetical protein
MEITKPQMLGTTDRVKRPKGDTKHSEQLEAQELYADIEDDDQVTEETQANMP